MTRRSSLLLPLLLAACGGEERRDYPPLRYNYLLPLGLNVAQIRIEQRYMPSGAPPDVSQLDPAPPVDALRNMATDRLQALGAAGTAVFSILNAALIRKDDTLSGTFEVELDVYSAPDTRAAYATASVTGSYTGDLDDIRGRLYDMTRSLMDRMNVEFEYQVRRSLGGWLLSAGVPQAPVQQQPLIVSPPPDALPPGSPPPGPPPNPQRY
ncbi:MAG TPA: hypothetical protein VKQ27_10895 [Acetobacteraceae bacterium]|nr:hypothetical protein [Acetobacteraceae bacterium]